MNYQELLSLVGGSNPQDASYQDIISGIQSQYTPQMQFAPTRSLLDTLGEQLPEQPRIAYGSLLQAQPRKLLEPFDISKYITKTEGDTVIDTGLTGGDSGGGGLTGGDGTGASTTGSTGFTIDANGLAIPNTVNQGLASVIGMITGLPLGLMNSIVNASNTAAANAFNAAMQAEANDAIGSIAASSPAATAGATGTGAAAAAAGTAAAAAASAAGMSDAAAAAAGQAAANASVSGASAAAAAAAGAAAAAAASASDGVGDSGGGNSGIGDSGGGGGGGGSDGSAGAATSGDAGWAKGCLVTMNRLIGTDPMGQDEGYGALQSGEYVIKKNAVDKYGEEFLGLLNSGKLTKKQINSLL